MASLFEMTRSKLLLLLAALFIILRRIRRRMMLCERTLHNKVCLITGGGQGIGRLMALRFAQEGCKVALWDIRKDLCDKLLQEKEMQGGGHKAYHCDVQKREVVKSVAEETMKDFGRVDIIVNNAGIVSGKKFLDCSDIEMQRTMDINVMAHFWICKELLPQMISRDSGHLVTVSSAAGLTGVPGLADYCASKFAAFGFNESLRLEFKKNGQNVKTTAVCPYYINTGMFDGAKSSMLGLLYVLDPQKVADQIVDAVKLGDEWLCLPPIVSLGCLARTILPVAVLDRLFALLGMSSSMDDFKGVGGAERAK